MEQKIRQNNDAKYFQTSSIIKMFLGGNETY